MPDESATYTPPGQSAAVTESTTHISSSPSVTSSTTTTTTTTSTTTRTTTTWSLSSTTSATYTSSTFTSSTSADPTTSSSQSTSATHSSTPALSGTPFSTSDPTSPAVASGGRFGTGTLAGAIVGSFLGGCIIAFLIAFLLLRRRKRTPGSSTEREYSKSGLSESLSGPDKSLNKVPGSTVNTKFDGISNVTSNVEPFDLNPYIPESADDATICMRIQTFFDQVSLHIDNFYSRPDSTIRLNQEDKARIGEYDSPFLGTPLISLLSNARTQRTVLTHALVHSLVQRIHPGTQTQSLLPPCYSLGQNSQDNKTLVSGTSTLSLTRIL